MKNAKLIIGIISMILFVLITFQSCAAGLGNALAENGESSGSYGFFVAFLILIAGIIAVVTKNSTKMGGSLTSAIIYVLGGIIGISGAGSYSDLVIWGVVSFVFAVVFFIFAFLIKKQNRLNE